MDGSLKNIRCVKVKFNKLTLSVCSLKFDSDYLYCLLSERYEEVVLINSHLGLEIYYLSPVDSSKDLAILLEKVIDFDRDYTIVNYFYFESISESFTETLTMLTAYPACFLMYLKRLFTVYINHSKMALVSYLKEVFFKFLVAHNKSTLPHWNQIYLFIINKGFERRLRLTKLLATQQVLYLN